ncbi:hypothetical protein U1Q18_000094, partial [Sarracenia purpurea var. burkii]
PAHVHTYLALVHISPAPVHTSPAPTTEAPEHATHEHAINLHPMKIISKSGIYKKNVLSAIKSKPIVTDPSGQRVVPLIVYTKIHTNR